MVLHPHDLGMCVDDVVAISVAQSPRDPTLSHQCVHLGAWRWRCGMAVPGVRPKPRGARRVRVEDRDAHPGPGSAEM